MNSPSDVSRLWVLPRLLKLGVQLSPKRLDAFIRGDQSGAVLDRVFVCGAHVVGMGFLRTSGTHLPFFGFMRDGPKSRGSVSWSCSKAGITGSPFKP